MSLEHPCWAHNSMMHCTHMFEPLRTLYASKLMLFLHCCCMAAAAAAAAGASGPYANKVWGPAPADGSFETITPEEVDQAKQDAKVR